MTWGPINYGFGGNGAFDDLSPAARAKALYEAQRNTKANPYASISQALEATRTMEDMLTTALAYLDKAANLASRHAKPELRERIEALGKSIAVLADEIDEAQRRAKLEKAPGCIRVKESAT
jgi:inorganic triphosphatase YgiF